VALVDDRYLVGDAAGGVPYQQSLNLACRLVNTLTQTPHLYEQSFLELWDDYNDVAGIKSIYIRIASLVCRHRRGLLCAVVCVLVIAWVAWRTLHR
jgi:hypothetical protein